MTETMWVERLKQVDGQWKWVPMAEEFDLQADFAISESELNSDVCRMGQLMVRYGGIAAEQDANLSRKEEYAKLVFAQVSQAHRSQMEATGGKPTADKIKDIATADPNYQQALSELHILRADAVKADHWWRSIVQKAELVRALMFRQNSEMKHLG